MSKPTPTSEYLPYDPPNGKALIDDLESLTRFLLRIMETIAQTRGERTVFCAFQSVFMGL